MSIVFGIIGCIASFCMVYYREQIGNMFGDPEWAQKVGGIYNVMVILAVLGFFWSVAVMTGTTGVLFAPLISFFSLGKAVGP